MISELNAPFLALRLSTFDQLLCHGAGKAEFKNLTETFVWEYTMNSDNTSALIALEEGMSEVAYKRISWYGFYFIDEYYQQKQRSKLALTECFHLLSLPLQHVSWYHVLHKIPAYIPEFLDQLWNLKVNFPTDSPYGYLLFNLMDPKLTHHPKVYQH